MCAWRFPDTKEHGNVPCMQQRSAKKMTEAEAKKTYKAQLTEMLALYNEAKWTPGQHKGKCAEDVMEEEVPPKHWVIVRRLLIDEVRYSDKATTCNFCNQKFESHRQMVAHRGHQHPERLKKWRNRGIPRDYRAGVQITYIMRKYGIRRADCYKVLADNNVPLREEVERYE